MHLMAKAYSAIVLGVVALSACEPYPYRYGPGPSGYGPPPDSEYYDGAPGPDYQSSYYEDPCETAPDYCNYGYYEGPLWFGGGWYGGPHRWRAGDHGREFYIRGGWHNEARAGRGGNWHGPGHYDHGHR